MQLRFFPIDNRRGIGISDFCCSYLNFRDFYAFFLILPYRILNFKTNLIFTY